jgi:thiol-disulfide isomerase/thioredoxin
MVVAGGFLVGAILFAQLANPVHRVFDPFRVERLISIKQLFSAGGLEAVATKAPDPSITTIAGKHFTLKELSSEKQLVVVNFWASWCRPCIEEMPHFERAHRVYRDKRVAFLGIATKDSKSRVTEFVTQNNITYDIALDDHDKITSAFGGVKVLPTTVFIDNKNNILKIHSGHLSQEGLEEDLRNLLFRTNRAG